jgi:hypothetical protein
MCGLYIVNLQLTVISNLSKIHGFCYKQTLNFNGNSSAYSKFV